MSQRKGPKPWTGKAWIQDDGGRNMQNRKRLPVLIQDGLHHFCDLPVRVTIQPLRPRRPAAKGKR